VWQASGAEDQSQAKGQEVELADQVLTVELPRLEEGFSFARLLGCRAKQVGQVEAELTNTRKVISRVPIMSITALTICTQVVPFIPRT
jgi:hypothetical protein